MVIFLPPRVSVVCSCGLARFSSAARTKLVTARLAAVIKLRHSATRMNFSHLDVSPLYSSFLPFLIFNPSWVTRPNLCRTRDPLGLLDDLCLMSALRATQKVQVTKAAPTDKHTDAIFAAAYRKSAGDFAALGTFARRSRPAAP